MTQAGLSFDAVVAMFGSMLVLAFVPGMSVLVVSARTAAAGFMHGLYTTLGIVAGDIVLIVVAIYGLSLLSNILGEDFVYIKYLGGVYLIFLGVVLWRTRTRSTQIKTAAAPSWWSSFLSGLLLTLADQKAILFYLGFLPALFDLSMFRVVDTVIVIAVAACAIVTAKLSYAAMVGKAGAYSKHPMAQTASHIAAAIVLIGVGVVVLVRG